LLICYGLKGKGKVVLHWTTKPTWSLHNVYALWQSVIDDVCNCAKNESGRIPCLLPKTPSICTNMYI